MIAPLSLLSRVMLVNVFNPRGFKQNEFEVLVRKFISPRTLAPKTTYFVPALTILVNGHIFVKVFRQR